MHATKTVRWRSMAAEILPHDVLALSHDHRLIDGRESQASGAIKEPLEDPTCLLLDVCVSVGLYLQVAG